MVSRGVRAACGTPAPGHARCFALVRTDIKPPRFSATGKITPSGYGPADLRSAYKLPSGSAGAGQTVAVVDAYDDPNAAADLAVYRAQYGLPPCTAASGCFRKVAQDGSANYPPPDPTWAGEISLDLDMVSAVCPNCHILLVEANSDSGTDLGAAVDEAVALGAKYVSNSYGQYVSDADASWQARDDQQYYDHPGVAVTAASGDAGYGVSYPAASPDVVAVGGTSLAMDASAKRGWNETAWSDTGSGCSASEPKPAWQHNKGCPHRTVADVSAVADPDTGVAVYDSYSSLVFLDGPGWQEFGGTSAASPIIASVYALAGSPSPAANPASYPYADPSGLNDVTSGSNSLSGCTPAYLCTAGPGYDGPTGLGTPSGVAAFRYGVHGPHGDLAGTVSSGGKPVPGAQVSAGGYAAITDSAGHYDLAAAPGTVSVTAKAFGYAAKTAPGVTVTAGQTQAENFALAKVPMETVSGTVTDGSGHGWPLYAQVSAAGTPATAYTDPATGRYRLRLPAGASYTLQASPLSSGYQQTTQQVSVRSAATTADITVPIDDGAGCTAPGYHVTAGGFAETFNASTIPAGWSIVNAPGDGPGDTWRFDQPDGYPNKTGGKGNYAAGLDTDNGGYPVDTELITPVINMSADLAPQLTFDNWVSTSIISESVEVSTDGGSTWSTAWSNQGFASQVTVPLPQAAGQASVRLRIHMTEPENAGSGDTLWQIDNVKVTDCSPASGGLVVGTVADANTGLGLDGATVTRGHSGVTATSGPVPGDPHHSHGFYSVFSPAGTQRLTATAPGYATGSGTVAVAAGKVSTADLALNAGQVSVSGGPVTGGATLGGSATATITVRNTGSAPATVSLDPRPGGFTPAGQPAARGRAAVSGYPVRLARVRFGVRPGALPVLAGPAAGRRPGGVASPAWLDNSPWVRLPQTPGPLALAGAAGAVDPVSGKVYAAGGEADAIRQRSALSVFDPSTSRWSELRPMSYQRAFASAAFIGGRLYVTGGIDTGNDVGVPQTEIYDPASGTWTQGAPVPHPYGGAATVVLDGKMYLIGGCASTGCETAGVQVYNPATNRWSAAAGYPIPIAWANCGAIAGQIYCAGGSTGNSMTSAGYAYDPATGKWTPIASLPADAAYAANGVADGELLVSGGVTVANGSTSLTNQGYAYDPASNAWSALPNQPQPVFDTASACGFYIVGGLPADELPTAASWQLPGYGGCGGQDWLTASPATSTLAPGQTSTVKVTLNAADPSVTVPGTYTASFRVGNDTPYPAPVVPVTFTVKPPKTWGQLAGTVTGTTCAGATKALPGATVQISAGHSTWLPATDAAGHYGQWLPAAGKASVITSLAGWQPQSATVSIPPGTTTTHNVALKPVCG